MRITLKDATDLVKSWCNPDGSSRVARVGYIATADVVEVLSETGVEELPLFGGQVESMVERSHKRDGAGRGGPDTPSTASHNVGFIGASSTPIVQERPTR